MLAPLLALLAVQPVASAAPDYVPDSGWRDNEWAQTFYERWFGNQLRALQEPPLSSRRDLGGFRERFRLLVLPTFEPAYAYRIDVRQDGVALLRWARLNGSGGSAPGALVRQGRRQLRSAETSGLTTALASAALGSLDRDEDADEGLAINSDGTQSITVCLDGTTYIFEYLNSEGRQFVVRSCYIDEDGLRRLTDLVFRLKPRNAMN